MRKAFAPLIILVFISLLSLPIVLSQSEPTDPLKSNIESYVSWIGSYPNTGGHIVYNFSSIHVGFTFQGLVDGGDLYWATAYTYLYLCAGLPGSSWWNCGYSQSFYLWFHIYTVTKCVEGVCWDEDYLTAILVDPHLYGSQDGWLVYNNIRLYRGDEIKVHVWVVGYTLYVDEQCGGWITVYLNYQLKRNDEVVDSRSLAYQIDPGEYCPAENYSPGYYNPGEVIKERYVDFRVYYWGDVRNIYSWGYKAYYYIPQPSSQPPPETTPPPETPPETTPEEPIGEPVTVYYDSSPIVKMSIADAVRLGFYLYRKPPGVPDTVVIYHYLTMREFRYKLSSEYEYYLLTLTDSGETQKHRMLLYNSNLSRVEGEYIFRSMDHFTITCYSGELRYFFYRSRYGRSLIIREEKLINLGNEFIMYPLVGGVNHTFQIQSSRDTLDLTIYIPYRFGTNYERDDYMVRIPTLRFYTSNGYFRIMYSRLKDENYEYEYVDSVVGSGTYNVTIMYTIRGESANETYVFINGAEYLTFYFIDPKPIIGRPKRSPISEILMELTCKLTDPNSYIHFVVSTSTAYRIETTQFTLLPLKDFVNRLGINETHFKLYLEFWMRPVTNVEILRDNVTVKIVRDLLKIREGNCAYELTHVYYSPETGLYRSSVTSKRECMFNPPLWTKGFESMVIQVEKRGFAVTVYTPSGRRDYYTEIIMPNTDEYRQYSYQGYISAFVITNCIDVLQYSSSKRLRVEPTFVDTIGAVPSIEKVEIPRLELPDWWNLPGWLSFIGNLLYTYLTIIINLLTTLFSAGVVLIPSLLKMFGVLYVVAVAGLSLYNPSKLVTMHVEIFFLLEKLLKRLWEALVSFAKLIASIISALKPI